MSRSPKNKVKKKPASPQSSKSQDAKLLPVLVSWLAMATILLASLSRIFLASVAMTRDEGAYGYLGKLAASGFTPYVDFYEMKPPFLFYLYGLGGGVFGFSDLGLRLFGLFLNVVSCLLIYLTLKRYVQKPYALISAAMFALLSVNPYVFGFTMVAEHIVNALVLLSVYLVHKSYDLKGLKFLILAGASFAIAILTKQTAIVLSPVFLLIFILEKNKKPWMTQTAWFAAGAIIPALLMLILLMITGSLDEALYWLIKYPSQYTSTVGFEKGMGFLRFFFSRITGFQMSLFIIASLALITNLIYFKRRPNNWLLIYLFLAVVSILPGFRFYGQYWLLLFVPLAMLTGSALHEVGKKNLRIGMFSGLAVIAFILIELVAHKNYYFFKGYSPDIEKLYVNNPFDAIRKLSKYAGTLMNENENLMVIGSEPQAYLYADKIAPTKHVFMSMISNNDNASLLRMDAALNDLKTKKPEYVLYNLFPFSWGLGKNSSDHLYQGSFSFVNRNYTPVAAYHMESNRYLYANSGDQIDPTLAKQVILFKLR